MSLKKFFSRKKEEGNTTDAPLEHGALLVLLFEEDEIADRDVDAFRKVCEDESWDYDKKVIDNLGAALKRRLAECGKSPSQEAYEEVISRLHEKALKFAIEPDAMKRLRSNVVLSINNHFLKKLKVVSRNHLAGIEHPVFSHLVKVFDINEAERAATHFDDMLNVLAMASIRSNIKYLQILLSGESPRFDSAIEHLEGIFNLAERYNTPEKQAMHDMVKPVAETIYEKVQAYLLIKDPTKLDIYQSREKILSKIQRYQATVQYQGVWKERFENLDLEFDV